MNSITILLKPSFKSTREKLGIGEMEDYDSDSILFQQGFDIQEIEVEPGESFTISKMYEEAYVQCEGRQLKLIKGKRSHVEEDDEQLTLCQGKYQFRSDGLTIEQVEKLDDDFESDFDDEFEY